MLNINYNPDVLTCLANLSNDEVFTPPDLVNQMLDMLPAELWTNKEAKFLDPVTKSGVFLREITKRLIKGLEAEIPDLQTRLNHILTKQVYGIAITELTSLLARRSVYCAKRANHAEYSMCTEFEAGEKGEQGNIRFERIAHTWTNGKCSYCGASQEVYDRADALETHAYQFIHCDDPKILFEDNMKFDVIIGNPPYQLSDGGAQASASPIYHKFIQQAKKLNPRYLSMIVPSRWFSGGKGLDEFRAEMLSDRRIRVLHDYLNAKQCFGEAIKLEGGVCFFLWDRDTQGLCEVNSHSKDKKTSVLTRSLSEDGGDTFIRYNEAISILNKVQNRNESSFSEIVSSRKPFGLDTQVKGKKSKTKEAIALYQNGGVGFIHRDEILKNHEWIDAHKIYVSMAYGMGSAAPYQVINKPFVGDKKTACTETYLLIGAFEEMRKAENAESYMRSRFFRFLVLLIKNTQHATKKVYQFVPMQDFNEPWTDEKLYAKYGLTADEIAFIESMIRPMDLGAVASDALIDAVEVDDE